MRVSRRHRVSRGRSASRSLNASERAAAVAVFGDSIDYDAVVLKDAPIMGMLGYARTTPWAISFPVGTVAGGGPGMSWLIHELCHRWQYARGVSMARMLVHAVRGIYDYGGEQALTQATAAEAGLAAFNTEQQAAIAADAYRALASRTGSNLATFQPYLAEFSSGQYRRGQALPVGCGRCSHHGQVR